MSTNSPKSTSDHTDTERKDMPRKRSKVSRACDACRRKKVRCDAEFLITPQKVTKLCTNCVRSNDVCTFARVPLKRGPLKGYSRTAGHRDDAEPGGRSRLGLDLGLFSNVIPPLSNVGLSLNSTATSFATLLCSMSSTITSHVGSHPAMPVHAPHAPIAEPGNSFNLGSAPMLGSSSVDASRKPTHAQIATLPSPVPQLQFKPLLHRLKFLELLPASFILLPPLHGYTQLLGQQTQVKMVPQAGANACLGPLGNPNASNSIQGLPWKVPYEMPETSGRDNVSARNAVR